MMDQAYLNTTVAYLSQHLLSAEQIQELATADSAQMRQWLKQADLSLPEKVSPAQIEQNFIQKLLAEARLLLRGMDSASQHFIEHWLTRFELINLKSILRGKFLHLPVAEIEPLLLDLGDFSHLPIADLLATESVEELLRHLQKTHYQPSADQARKALAEQGELFDVETALDRQYYYQLRYLSKFISQSQQAKLRCLMQLYFDRVNLLTLMRFRLNYGLSAPHSYFLLAPAGHHLSDNWLQKISQLDQFEAMIKALPPSLGRLLQGADSIEAVDQKMAQQCAHCAQSLLDYHPFELARAWAYLYLREQQMQWLHTAIKGHLLDLTAGLIESCTLNH